MKIKQKCKTSLFELCWQLSLVFLELKISCFPKETPVWLDPVIALTHLVCLFVCLHRFCLMIFLLQNMRGKIWKQLLNIFFIFLGQFNHVLHLKVKITGNRIWTQILWLKSGALSSVLELLVENEAIISFLISLLTPPLKQSHKTNGPLYNKKSWKVW